MCGLSQGIAGVDIQAAVAYPSREAGAAVYQTTHGVNGRRHETLSLLVRLAYLGLRHRHVRDPVAVCGLSQGIAGVDVSAAVAGPSRDAGAAVY